MLGRSLGKIIREVEKVIVNDILNGKIKTERVVCRFCGSEIIWKYGTNKNGVQRYKCPKCDKVFLDTDALPNMRIEIKQLGDIMGQYYGGMSYKDIRRQFKQQHDIDISRSSFHRWLTKFTKKVVDEASKYHPKVGEKWIADECVLKIGGKNIWCWDVISADNRYLLATHLSPTRTTQDAKKLMEKAVKVAGGKPPKILVTDSLRAYVDGVELAFGAETKHIQSEPFAKGDLSTNLIERWHSTLRTRSDIMRGLKSLKTAQALLDGWLVHYNYFRPHESLNDRTPADVAGIIFPYKDWLEVIQGQMPKVEDDTLEQTPEEQLESYRHPSYKAQIRRKAKHARKQNKMPTTLKGLKG